MNRSCSGRDLDFKGVQGACTVIQFGRGNNICVFYECRAESVDSTGIPTGSVQCEVYPLHSGGYSIPEAKERFALAIIESTEKFGGGFVQSVGVALMARQGDADGMGDSATGMTSFCASSVAKASKGTQRNGAVAVPKVSPGSRSQYPVKGIVCRPDTTKCSARSWPS